MRTTTYRRPGMVSHEHVLEVPLDHARPDAERIEVFARELVAPDRESERLPYLLWLNGGPGHPSMRPATASGWLAAALREFRVVLLDQRGTGRSTQATRQTLPERGDAAAQAEYLTRFRADAIVRDAELFRRELADEAPWSLLGQSYGGFCVLTYLSLAPEGVREALVTGGLAGLDGGPDPVYRLTYARVRERDDEYFERYPDDQRRAREIVAHLADTEERLPTGERLSPRRFQSLGNLYGGATRFDSLHDLLEAPFVSVKGTRRLSDEVLATIGGLVSFAPNPLYAVLHESIYCQGEASNWSAERIRGELGGEFEPDAERLRLTGEMIYPWQFAEDPALVPLADVAQALAAKADWPALYDVERLAANRVPVAAAVYVDDMYVPFELSRQTARRVGNVRTWITNTHHHDGLRADGEAIFTRLLDMVRERA